MIIKEKIQRIQYGKNVRSKDLEQMVKEKSNNTLELLRYLGLNGKGKATVRCLRSGAYYSIDPNRIEETQSMLSPNCEPKKLLCQYDQDGVLLRTFDSIEEATELVKVKCATIKRSVHNPQYNAAGFKWRYRYEEDTELHANIVRCDRVWENRHIFPIAHIKK